jgi:tetratricopeptide (TPR) repeat protein
VSVSGQTEQRRRFALVLAVVLGFGASVALARVLDAGRPALRVAVEDEVPYLRPEAATRLAAGFGGLAADWYWLTALQYVGRKVDEQNQAAPPDARGAVQLDRLAAVNADVLGRLLELITALDPRFTAVYEFAAVVLPVVDAPAAAALLERGIQANPDQWYLHQQLAYIYWQRGDYLTAADAFRRGARMTTATWMEYMAEKMEREGDDPQLAQAMYARMYEQAQDAQVKQWALTRLLELRSLQERAAIRGVLNDFVTATGQCPRAWSDVTTQLRAAGLTVHSEGLPIDPSGTPYVLVRSALGCDVSLHRLSTVPRG